MSYLSTKAWSEAARESAIAVRRGGQATGSQKPQGAGVQMGGMTVSPAIAARVKQILAEKTKGKGKAGGKGGKAKADAAAKKAERAKEQAAKKEEREKAKMARDMERTKKQAEREQAKKERLAAQTKKQAAQQKKMKQAAQAKRAKDKANAQAKTERAKQAQDKQAERTQAAKERLAKSEASKKERTEAQAKKQAESQAKQKQAAADRSAKQAAAQDRKKRVLAERIKRGEKLSASDTVDAQDAGLIKAGKAMTYPLTDFSDHTVDDMFAVKAGARHSKMDMEHIQGIHDHAVACGANCDGPGDGEDDDDEMDSAEKAIKGIMDDPGYYAQHECGDIMQASNALATMAMLLQSELSEEDEDTKGVEMLCDAARTLVDFISGELDELEQAAKDDAEEDATVGHEPMKALKAIGKREDVNPKAGVSQYGDVTFADEKNKKYPIDTEEHIRAAYNYINHPDAAGKYSPAEVTTIKNKIIAAWKKKIDPAGPPSAGKAWGLPHIDGDAIKALDNDILRGYAVRFGDADHPDLQKDYYTKATDFWLDHFGWPRPITYHHGMDAGTRNDPVIGHWLKAGVDDVGVWMEGQMDRAHAYYKAMKELAQRGYLRLSSDSAPQWVIRERQQNGVSEIKRWPLVTSSVTVTPMEPRMLPVEVKAYLAEIGLDIDADAQANDPDDARGDGLKASDEERAKLIMLELDLIELEATI